MEKSYHALHIGEKEANYLYPAMPDCFRSEYSQEAFANYIENLLTESGDIESWQDVTELGESHGFRIIYGCSAEYDENGRMIFHSRHPLVTADSEGEKYIVELIKSKYPEFDESLYHKHCRQIEIDRKSSIIHGQESYKRLPSEVSGFLRRIICNEIDNPYIFICCDYEDESDIIDILNGYEWVYYNKKDIMAVSGKQFAVNWQFDTLRQDNNGLFSYIINNLRFAIILDRIEDIPKYPYFQERLPELLSSIVKKQEKIIFLSQSDPTLMLGLSNELWKLLMHSCYYFDARVLCRVKKNPEILEDPELGISWQYDLQNYERSEYTLNKNFGSLPF